MSKTIPLGLMVSLCTKNLVKVTKLYYSCRWKGNKFHLNKWLIPHGTVHKFICIVVANSILWVWVYVLVSSKVTISMYNYMRDEELCLWPWCMPSVRFLNFSQKNKQSGNNQLEKNSLDRKLWKNQWIYCYEWIKCMKWK